MSYIIKTIKPEDVTEKMKLTNILNEMKGDELFSLEKLLKKLQDRGFVICKIIKI